MHNEEEEGNNINTPIQPSPGVQEPDRRTHKAGGVVVSHGLGVTEGFQHRVGLHDLVLEVL